MNSHFGNAAKRHPLVIAHRGVSAHFPENTRAAFEAAVETEADAIELDLQLTADRQIVISHDSSLSRCGHPEVIISETTAAELTKYDIGSWMHPRWSSQRILSLPQMLREFGHRIPLMLEVKLHVEVSVSVFADELVSVLTEFRTRQPMYLLCFDLAFLCQIHERIPWISPVWNARTTQGIETACRHHGDWLHGIDCRISALDADAVAMIRAHDCLVFAFTCNSAEHVAKANQLCVDGMIADDPDAVRQMMSVGNTQAG